MAEIGFTLASEDWSPRELVQLAQRAEEVGFEYALISDHIHPWNDNQGSSPFVWSVIGSISQATERLRIGTGVSCPLIRIHPAIVAHAAATSACLLPGRFFLGLGTGENLNEHVLGDRWPETAVRQEMLEEAIEVIRLLWEGGLQSHHGKHYTVENARLYTLPEELPQIIVAAAGPQATKMAGKIGDGLFGLVPDADVIDQFEKAGGRGKPRFGQLHVCWAASEKEARATAREWWPNAAVSGNLNWELPLPSHFEAASEWVDEDAVAESVVCGPDPERHIEGIKEFIDAGYDNVYFHQVGPDQEGFLQFAEAELLPRLQ
jgi:coenzyme F420-dependent glucose-6-phosphate dehydrogenase